MPFNSKTKLQEITVQKALANYYTNQNYTVKREVETPIGIIDLLLFQNSTKILIEVKEYKSLKHAVGQIQSYKLYHPDVTECRIIYFSYDFKHRQLPSAFNQLPIDNLTFISINNLISTDELYSIQQGTNSDTSTTCPYSSISVVTSHYH